MCTQLRKNLTDVTEKQRGAEHEREVAETKVLEVRQHYTHTSILVYNNYYASIVVLQCCPLQLREEITSKGQEIDRESRRKAKLEKDLRVVQGELETRSQEVKAKQNQLQKAEEEYKRCEQQLRETRVHKQCYLDLYMCI